MAIYQAGLDSVPVEVVEAGAVDGASRWQLIRHILLPLLRPSHFSLIILGTISSLKGFDLVYVLTRGGPADTSQLPTTYMLKVAFELFEQGKASVIAVLVFVIALVITIIQLRVYRRGDL
jgi:ABC-type sugar transport system permease subunit